ncbi:phospholipase [Nocardia sp. 852002-20019_SCH5090214]|uniref:phospholipase C n=1 Tax=Nocardia nova TaxID=37330 RepID=A0A2S6A7Y7_9NOCA|nr:MULTISPECIES: alkaline phosphatase family protein [Nocardia]OBF65283.1 phospholipase [Mycobacterium sp. 852002-51759_SCH5129042]MBF6274508.1 phospholipase C [Nocardia nova]OBA49204.1 phospholipase [Nocardia sp. 852002-51101_SCH5132738]OBA68147.1 phospholipase [Nocardia sp. 852002-20019_SCH5090214]OBB42285.1 phospholipase [Nocardia sp. 852002-51244_SCH5132740]
MGLFDGINRRDFLAKAMAAGGAGALAAWANPIIERAHAADPAGMGGLGDIEHFVLLMQENRSFDHYFGTLSGVRGFDDPSPAWKQYGYAPGVGPTADGFIVPFRLDTTRGATLDGECINDPDHSWAGMHEAWNGGRNDRWMPMSVAGVGAANGPAAMGYYTRADIPVHHELADAFTLCDHYHCSVLGPTDPNRLYWISATIDPDGLAGGPMVETPTLIPQNVYSWRTYPENLSEAGVDWKIYNNRDVGPISSVILDGMMGCFTQAADPNSELAKRGKAPVYPQDFAADVAADRLPSVSWVIPPLFNCEHPALPPALGAVGIMQVLDILTSNPKVWEKTALIVSYDENGGFFDHVTPPTPPPGTPGEYLTVDLGRVPAAKGVAGPIGLGYRVPCFVISPYSRGGLVASQTFDHTSQLRLLERRFGVEVPNVTAWRRSVTGDMTSAFDFGSTPDSVPPRISDPKPKSDAALAQCGPNIALGTEGKGIPYPVPPNAMPSQEPGSRRTPSGLV